MTLVLLPGMDGTGDSFAAFLSAPGCELDVKVVSYPTDVALGYADLEAFARAALPTDRPFVILGESFSGPIAISLAAAAPPQLKGLILCATFARNPRPAFSWLRSLVPLLPVKAAPMRVLSHLLLGKFACEELRNALAGAMAKVQASVLRTRVAEVLRVDVTSKLAALGIPTLYLRATQDRLVPASAARYIAALNPRVQVTDIDAPHFLLQTGSAETARVIREFARTL